MKTHSGAKKRFKLTKGGKGRPVGRHAMKSHILGKKTPKRKRQLDRPAFISPADRERIKELLLK
jgi:large subunit ribosomal protein L35